MQCQTCGDFASVHLTPLAGGQRLVLHFCEGCAARLELEDDVQQKLADARSALARMATASIAEHGAAPKPCEGCGKVPDVRIRENHRGVRTEYHLCEPCFLLRLESGERRVLTRWVQGIHRRAELDAEISRRLEDLMARFGPLRSTGEAQ